ncbi:MAG: right-handed parallel beta-helix repeat-containing protein [Bacteroidia bacterium]|nr:right-handed parallel beta-helix repeat-containing protein [Bacteroidia bacterium]
MGLGNFLDPASQTLTWGRIEVTGTPTRTTKIQNATVSSLGCGFIDVPVTVLDFTNVGAVSLVLNYVPAVLEYNSVTINSALTGASSNLPAAGQFRLSRLGNDGITLDPNAVLFTLHFKLLTPSTASTNLTWSTEPGDCEYAGPGGEPVYVGSFIDQGVTIPARPVKNLNTLREYCKIQDAINDPLTLNTHDIECSPGIYPEAVKINKSIHLQGKAGEMLTTFIQAPATLPAASDPLSNIVLVTGSGVNAEISGLTIKGPGPTACGSMGRGIFVRDGATANIHHNQILDIRDNPFSGCQNGIAIQVGRNVWSTTGTATIAYNLITGYQKGAIVVDNTGSNATISNNIITGAGTTAVIGQNGIQISRGATATLTGNTVSGNSFFSTGHPDNYCGTGILLYQSGSVALTGGNNLSNNDQNYYAYGVTGALTMGAEIFGASAAAAGFGNQIVNASTQDIDARACTFYGVLPSAMPLTDLFSLEDMIYHEIDNPTLGFVYVNTVNTYVTANSFDAPGYPDAQIQRGIDAAGTTGWTVNVGPGNFDCSMDIAKSIQVLGQGPANTIVDRSLNTTAGDIVYIHNLSGDVKVDGFTIKTGPASSVASNGVNIRTLTGPGTITISNNEIWGVQSATQTAKINYGLIAGYFTVTTPKLVFDNNKVFGGSDNPILIEKWMGPTEITNNFLYQNPLKDFSASDVIFMMNYGGSHNTQKQLISGNTIDMGWGTTNQRGAGISVASSYTGGTPLGGFTDVAISNNILLNLKPNRRGISTWNNSSNGTGGDITNAVISGNAISNAEGLTGEFGIRVLGKATGTQIANNLISGVIDAVLIQPYNTHEATTTFVNNNSLLATGYGIRNTTTATIAATCNWYGTTVAAAVALKISGAVTYLPWLTSGDDAAPTTPGFQPLVPCAACVDLALTQTHVDIACPLVPTGSINLSVGAGVSPFAFAWAGPGGFISAIEDPSGLAIGTYTVLVTAANGCTGTLSVELVLQDQPAPVVGTPGGSTVQCVSDAVVPASVPVVTDACGTVIPTPVPVMTSSIVNCEGTVTYTYTYTDYQPKSTVWTYVYTVDDITAPLITAPANVAVPTNSGCNATGVALGSPTVSDNCTPTGSLLVTNDHPSTTYPLGVTTVTWTVTDCSGLTNTAPQTVTVSGLTVSGTVKYLDSNLTPMNVTVTMNPGALVTTTNSLGVYTFTGVCSGPYEVIITSSKAPGGINATDAAQVNFWGVSPYPIQKAKFLAGDVDNDLSLLSNDAAAIQGYFLSAFTTGFTPPWSFWKAGETISANPGAAGNPVITVLNTNLTQDFYGLVTGDFNGSFTGLKSAPRTLELNYSETTQVANAAEFELPVTSESNLQVGAISLIMDYPSDQVSVEGVYLRSDRNVPVQYAVLGDELRISWYSRTGRSEL